MKLVNFSTQGASGLGELVNEEVIDLSHVADDVLSILVGGEEALVAARRARASAPRWPLGEVRLGAPIARPPKFLGIGLNYAAHVAESGATPPEHQVWFNKQSTCVIGTGAPIVLPAVSSMVDYEGELGVVIAKRCRHVSIESAPTVVAGFTVINDVSARDWQWQTPTWTLGKSFDTHGPMGPALVTSDEVVDPHDLSLRTWVNGELRQNARTDDLIFNCWAMIAHLSTVFTLEPGDVLSTGTPAGCGFAFNPPRWLSAGDVVRIEIEGIGALENPVVDEAGQSEP
jgi:2-keto-4-pentenoate hydratase/2-oxohepta-3-ene-1,7-dioic acid hydratase in catechol pathway